MVMFRSSHLWLAGLTAFATTTPVLAQTSNVCFMLYQMADNDLEVFLRADNNELIQSPAIRQDSLTTWVYFDGRNIVPGFINDLFQNIYEPLEDVYERDGSPYTTSDTDPFKGSLYMTWDHDADQMVVDQELEGEQNGDDPSTIQAFVTHALTDCIENRGSTEFMLVLSSHGAGWRGFGGDEHAARRQRRQRQLVAENDNLVSALEAALAAVEGAPDRFDVLGFDACLMSDVGALDEYHTIAKYFIASEATEPGHGWAYNFLSQADSAVSMAQEFLDDFLVEQQGSVHQTPKTLALIDTDLYLEFLQLWDAFAAELTRLLRADDPFLFPILSRARQVAISFVAFADEGQQKSAIDVGSFLATFDAACQPEESSELFRLRSATVDAYNAMQLASGVGEGTREATGVQVFWPPRRDYDEYKSFYDNVLFEEPLFALTDAPNWLEFMQTYYASTTSQLETGSVCRGDPSSVIQPTREGQLLLNPTSEEDGTDIVVQSEVILNVDDVTVEFGLDLTPGLELLGGTDGRLLKGMYDPSNIDNSTRYSQHPILQRFHQRRQKYRRRGRRLQQYDEDDYLILFGGDVEGTYDGAKYKATWDGHFFVFMDDAGQLEPAFAIDLGEQSRALPVMYFPPGADTEVTGEDFPHRTTEEEAEALGGVYGYLNVLATGSEGVLNDLALYTESLDTFSETPRSAGGQIVPIIYSEAYLGGNDYFVYVGGFNGTVFEWNEDSRLSVTTLHWTTVLEQYERRGVDTVVVDFAAYDLDKFDENDEDSDEGFDVAFFTYPEESMASLASLSLATLGSTMVVLVGLLL